jgi:hypothetical protein
MCEWDQVYTCVRFQDALGRPKSWSSIEHEVVEDGRGEHGPLRWTLVYIVFVFIRSLSSNM